MKRSRWQVVLAGLVVVAGLSGIVRAQTAPAQTTQSQDDFLKNAFLKTTAGLVAPKATVEVQPKYTPEAMRAKIQGTVKLQVIVEPDGTVSRVRVLQSLDKDTGLDDAAVAAAKQWKFTPGTLQNRNVPCAVELELNFRLH